MDIVKDKITWTEQSSNESTCLIFPYHKDQNICQMTLEILSDEEYWRRRSCSFSCLKFCLNHFWRDISSIDIPEISERDFSFYDFWSNQEKSYKFFSKDSGWNNYAILELAREEWLLWKVYNKKFDTVDEFRKFFWWFKDNAVFFVSVDFRWEIDDKIYEWSHIIIISWIFWDKVLAKNPYDWDDHKIYEINDFIKSLKWNIVAISDDQENDDYKAFSPIKYNEKKNTFSQNNDEFITIKLKNWVIVKVAKDKILNWYEWIKESLINNNDSIEESSLYMASYYIYKMVDYYTNK